MTLTVKRSDLLRATLPAHCGNTGYLGIAPDGSQYHVVVPVDAQIARGLKAGSRPDDGTPFGGYRGWHYFQCDPYIDGLDGAREARAIQNARSLAAWARERGIDAEVKE